MNYSYWLDQIKNKLKDNAGSGILGVFDSGIGGLTVIPTLQNSLKKFDIVYLGDTIHFPYGEKDSETLSFLVLSRITDLLNYGCEAIAIACNTASIAFEGITTDTYLKSKIIGTINCTSEYIFQHREAHRIGLIGTEYTVRSKVFERSIRSIIPHRKIFVEQSAEQPLIWGIELGDDKVVEYEIYRIVDVFKKHNIDTFVLGCTHYAHVKDKLQNLFGDDVTVINPSEILGAHASQVVTNKGTSNLTVMFTGKKPKLSGMFKKYSAYINYSQEKLLPFDQIGQMRLMNRAQ